MPHLFIILLKINLVLILFAATYYLVLRRLTFYVLNRCFLALGIVFSTAYPFIDLTDFFHQRETGNAMVTYLPQLNEKASALVPTGFFINNWPILSALFYLGVLLMTIRLAIQFISLYKIHRKSSPSTVANYKVRTLNESVSPFSFWQTIYVNPTLHNEKELDTILAHETVHVKQWHSIDIILVELSVVFYWFNPGIWLMKKAVKENLEFITDQKILKKGMDRKAYQYSLLGVGQLNTSVAIVNNFNLSDLKKRIKMMNVKRSSRLTLSRYAFALPVLLLTTLAFTVSKKEVKAHLPQLSEIIPHLKVEKEKEVVTTPITKTKKQTIVKNKLAETVTHKDTILNISRVIKTIVVKQLDTTTQPTHSQIQEILAAIKGDLNIPSDAKTVVGTKVVRLVGVKKDSIAGTKPSEMNKVSVRFRAIGEYKNDSEPNPDKKNFVIVSGYKKSDTTLHEGIDYIVNGKPYQPKDFKKLNADEIQRVDVIKNTEGRPQMRIEMKKKAEL